MYDKKRCGACVEVLRKRPAKVALHHRGWAESTRQCRHQCELFQVAEAYHASYRNTWLALWVSSVGVGLLVAVSQYV